MGRVKKRGTVPFQPRARLLKLIGAELVSDEVVAVTELVKNAHDADASTVKLEFRNVTGAGGSIVVRDNGCGMTLDDLLERWMQPAGSDKNRSSGLKSRKGRRFLGEKGVGRFATDRLGQFLELESRPRGAKEILNARFDWDEFDSDTAMLSDIRSQWRLVPVNGVRWKGTVLRMRGLRVAWNERMFRRLSMRLSRLLFPFRDRDDFRIIIDSDEFPEYSGKLRSEIIDRAPYRIDASFNGRDAIRVKLNGSRAVEHPWNGSGKLSCGPVRVRIFAFDLEGNALARVGPRMEVRAWMREWSGISIYRDGFRIWPYGEPHDDWLRLDQRRVNNPVVRLSNNQIVGFVEVSADRNPDLRDQTNREGLMNNSALADLRRLMYFVLQIVETDRQRIKNPSRSGAAPEESRSATGRGDPIGDLMDRISRKIRGKSNGNGDASAVDDLKVLREKVRERVADNASVREQLLQGYSELAAMGQAAHGLSEELRPVMESLRSECAKLREMVEGAGSRTVKRRIGKIEEIAASLESRLAMAVPIGARGKTRRRTIDVVAEVGAFMEQAEPVLEARGVRLEVDVERRKLLRTEMQPERLHRILHILMTNSLDWIRDLDKPTIRLRVGGTRESCEIIFSDNGPGINPQLVQRVFEPMFSCKEDGRGMGLTIARNLVGDIPGGQLEAVVDGRRRGANFRVVLPRKRSRATMHRR